MKLPKLLGARRRRDRPTPSDGSPRARYAKLWIVLAALVLMVLEAQLLTMLPRPPLQMCIPGDSECVASIPDTFNYDRGVRIGLMALSALALVGSIVLASLQRARDTRYPRWLPFALVAFALASMTAMNGVEAPPAGAVCCGAIDHSEKPLLHYLVPL